MQVKKAIEKGNIDGAKIYAQNAIRKKTEALNYLRLASRLDAVVSRLDTQAKMNMINSSMSQIVRSLDRVSLSLTHMTDMLLHWKRTHSCPKTDLRLKLDRPMPHFRLNTKAIVVTFLTRRPDWHYATQQEVSILTGFASGQPDVTARDAE